jgi:hypothetical protein
MFVDATEGRAKHLIAETAVSPTFHESVNQADNRKARACCIANWGPTAICVPTENFSREVQATHGVHPSGELDATRRHLKNVCSARYIENVWTLEESRERLTVLTVADEAKASGWRDLASDTTHVAT